MKSSLYTILFFVLFFNIYKVKAQDTGDAQKQYIPNITVAAPQAASISKVGEIPVDISTGRMNYTIPIFEIKEGNFSMPINLSYNYSGLLLDETPGYAGMGWAFNIGGSIVHSINGLDDVGRENDKVKAYNYINKLPPFDDYNSPEGLTTINHYLENVSNGIFDGEPDKYIVNAGNLNCSFYLDKDNNAIFLKNENYKVSGFSHAGFTIIDDKGINYIFNKPLNASKSSGASSFDYISSFLLTEINFPNTSNKVLFEYENVVTESYTDINLSQTLTQNSTQYVEAQGFELNNNKTYTIVETNKLKKITTNSCSIEFQYTNNPTEPAIKVINNINVKDKLSKTVKNFDFTYTSWQGRRTNLLNVKFNGVITNEMEYDMSIPYPVITADKDYAKKDLWGYYNKNGVPATVNGMVTPFDNPMLKPDFESTKIGALTKITYQTKGYSLIEYEPNNVFITASDYNFPYDSDGVVTSTKQVTTMANSEQNSAQDTFVVTKVPAKIKINYNFTNHTQTAPYQDRYGNEVSIVKGTEVIFSKKQDWSWELRWEPTDLIISNSKEITISISTPGTYTIKTYSVLGASASIDVRVMQSDESFNQKVGGMRVSTIKNCDFDGKCITTVYNYLQESKSTGLMLQRPEFYSGYHVQDNLLCTPSIFVRRDFYNYTSIYPLSNFRGSPVLYKKVEKIDFGKDKNNQLVSNGKTIFSYYGEQVSNSERDFESYFIIGQLNTKEVKDVENRKVLEETNNYAISTIPNTTKFLYFLSSKLVMEKRAQFSGGESSGAGCRLLYPRPLLDFQVSSFKYQSKNFILQKEKSTSYLDGNPLSQATVYDYAPDYGHLKSKTTINSKGETLETKLYYPTDSEMASEPLRNELVNKNMIGTPLVTQRYNGVKLSEEKTEYVSDASTSNLLMPKYIYANKGNIAIDKVNDRKITYDLYDEKGNILQYTSENGMPVSIIWGYNKTQPIAKIENTAYSTISAQTISNLQTLSNEDSDNCISGNCTEQILRNALNEFRIALPNAFISTYTYNPLVGVTSITDVKGMTSYYEYDSFGRLKFVKDKDLNVLQKYCYNYKGQQTDCSDNSSTSVVMYNSIARSGSFTRANCGAGAIASSVVYNQPAGAVISTISQADADSRGLDKFNIDGLANANATGFCTFRSAALSGSFQKENCPSGGVGSYVVYSLAEGAETSNTSQAAADALAWTRYNAEGIANANAAGFCTFRSAALSGSFQKGNCPAGGVGSYVGYSLAEGAETSNISQADADSRAWMRYNAEGSANANATGYCTFRSAALGGSFQKGNCPSGGVGSYVPYSLAEGAETSNISQADADSKAWTRYNAEGGANANVYGYCTFYSIGRSRLFTKYNCPAGGFGSSVLFDQASGAVTSTISQEDADSKGLDKFNTEGQIYANNYPLGTCTFYNSAKSVTGIKNNCGTGTYGSAVTYTVPAGKYSSSTSQEDADQQAQNDLTNNSRTYINANGICTSETYNTEMVDYDSNMSKVWVMVTSSSANHPDRTVNISLSYSYRIGTKIYNNGRWSGNLILPAGVTNQTFVVTLSFIGAPNLDSFTVN